MTEWRSRASPTAGMPHSYGASFSGVGLLGPRTLERRTEISAKPAPQPIGGGRFPVRFYLTAMLFIIFDIETIFLYPWAMSFEALGVFGFVEMVLFIVTVFIAYTYVWRRGGLNWD